MLKFFIFIHRNYHCNRPLPSPIELTKPTNESSRRASWKVMVDSIAFLLSYSYRH